MSVPEENHPRWAQTILGERSPNFEFLATKVLIGRLVLKYKQTPTPEELKKYVHELRDFFQRHENMPKAQADLMKIFE